VSDSAAPRSLVVQIQQAPGAGSVVLGSVTIVELGGATPTRKLKAASCEDVVEGLALIASVSLDPEALFDEPAPPQPAPPPTPPPAATPVLAAKPAVSTPANQPEPSARRPHGYRVSLSLEASLLVNKAPEPALGGAGGLALELRPGELLAPFARLSLAHAERRDLAELGGNANFAFTFATLELCPVRLGSRLLGVRPCAAASAGVLEVWGSQTLRKESHQRPLATLGPALLVELRLSKVLEIIANMRLEPALLRDRFAFDGVAFFSTPWVGFSSGLGLAGGFP
jgi:hypothetical protein